MTIVDIIERISIIRTRSNLSARALSRMIGKADNYINLLESKKFQAPSLTTLLEIIEACNSSPQEFFHDNIEQYQLDKNIMESLKGLTKNQKEAILNLLKAQ